MYSLHRSILYISFHQFEWLKWIPSPDGIFWTRSTTSISWFHNLLNQHPPLLHIFWALLCRGCLWAPESNTVVFLAILLELARFHPLGSRFSFRPAPYSTPSHSKQPVTSTNPTTKHILPKSTKTSLPTYSTQHKHTYQPNLRHTEQTKQPIPSVQTLKTLNNTYPTFTDPYKARQGQTNRKRVVWRLDIYFQEPVFTVSDSLLVLLMPNYWNIFMKHSPPPQKKNLFTLFLFSLMKAQNQTFKISKNSDIAAACYFCLSVLWVPKQTTINF